MKNVLSQNITNAKIFLIYLFKFQDSQNKNDYYLDRAKLGFL